MNNFSELSDFNAIIGAKESAEDFIRMTVEQIDAACFRDMYMNTIEAAYGHDIDPAELHEDLAAFEGFGPEISDVTEGLEDIPFDAVDEGSKCSNCGKAAGACECGTDPAIEKTINNIPGTDPTDAASFFSMTNKVGPGDMSSPKAVSAIKEQLDYIGAVIPDTVIECGTSECGTKPNGGTCENAKSKKNIEDGVAGVDKGGTGTLTESLGDDILDLDMMLL